MLRYDNPMDATTLTPGDVEDAARVVAKSVLITVAQESGLELPEDSYASFAAKVDEVLAKPDVKVTPADLVRHAEAYAVRGAQAVVAAGGTRLPASIWDSDEVCPLWPFC